MVGGLGGPPLPAQPDQHRGGTCWELPALALHPHPPPRPQPAGQPELTGAGQGVPSGGRDTTN